ncbi:unnamed protein product, partial [Symbiodinium necroappetens]
GTRCCPTSKSYSSRARSCKASWTSSAAATVQPSAASSPLPRPSFPCWSWLH